MKPIRLWSLGGGEAVFTNQEIGGMSQGSHQVWWFFGNNSNKKDIAYFVDFVYA